MKKSTLLRSNLLLPGLISSIGIFQLAGCDGLDTAKSTESEIVVTPRVIRDTQQSETSTLELAGQLSTGKGAFLNEAKNSEADVPYPLYPNAKRYHMGGEGGLQIVLFETTDPFYKVDAYYRDYIENSGYSRLLAMSDYVRYAAGEQDFDPWATENPGIVIHEFPNSSEAMRLGANDLSRTNIIMSF